MKLGRLSATIVPCKEISIPRCCWRIATEIRRRAAIVLEQAAGRPGHIFNLGHGILQQTDPDSAIALIEAVRELSTRPSEPRT